MIDIINRVVSNIDEISVMNDEKVIKLSFKCLNQVTELLRLSDCSVFINYQNGSTKDRYAVTDLALEGNYVTFSWTLGRNATKNQGKTFFVVCAQKMEGATVIQEWNSVLSYFDVKKGLETITQPTEDMEDLFAELTEMVNGKLEPSNIKAGDNISVDIDGNDVTISSQGGGASDYTDLENKPQINFVELVGNKSLSDLGIQPSGDYATNTALGEEETARQNADNNLQGQIDAITVSSDVVDVVGTYQDLVNYDTTHIKANDIIKVMQDSTHSNAISYYRWVITEGVGVWTYVGSEGPYYTKSEADVLLQGKINVQQSSSDSGKALMVGADGTVSPQNIPQGTTDYTDLTNKPSINSVELSGNKTSADLGLFEAPLTFTNKAVAQNDWTDNATTPDSGFEDYDYKAVITCEGVTASMLATVIFADEEAKSGNYALTCSTGSGTVTIYSNDYSGITIPTIVVGTPVQVSIGDDMINDALEEIIGGISNE